MPIPVRTRWAVCCLGALVLGALCWLAPQSVAQAPDRAPPPAKHVGATHGGARTAMDYQKVSVGEMIRVSGFCVYPLILLSFLTAALVIYLFFVVRETQVLPPVLQRELSSVIQLGTLDDIRSICRNYPSPLAATTMAAMEAIRAPGADRDSVLEAVEAEGSRQTESLQSSIRYLMDAAAVAPMIGLLGTVTGMLKAFRAVAIDETMARPMVLADGVRQALYTTAEGLAIAIPAAVFYAFFRERSVKIALRLEAAATPIVSALMRRND